MYSSRKKIQEGKLLIACLRHSGLIEILASELRSYYSETFLVRPALGETFCVGIDRISDYTVPNTENDQVAMEINVG